jgi:hypothetical protein
MVAAIIAELERQAELCGYVAETNGIYAQVDGSFKLEPLAQAMLRVVGEPPAVSEGLLRADTLRDSDLLPHFRGDGSTS